MRVQWLHGSNQKTYHIYVSFFWFVSTRNTLKITCVTGVDFVSRVGVLHLTPGPRGKPSIWLFSYLPKNPLIFFFQQIIFFQDVAVFFLSSDGAMNKLAVMKFLASSTSPVTRKATLCTGCKVKMYLWGDATHTQRDWSWTGEHGPDINHPSALSSVYTTLLLARSELCRAPLSDRGRGRD